MRIPAVLKEADLPKLARQRLLHPDRPAVADDLNWLRERKAADACILLSSDTDFPAGLKDLSDCPASIYVLGRIDALHVPQIAMVGTRRPTPSGRVTAAAFAEDFVRAGFAITSGLAEGIDCASHESALRANGVTIAVCATGLDRVYPHHHAGLAQRICQRGALISEFPPRTSPFGSTFARRNRLISGLSRGTVVVEAASGSGSLLTAGHAEKQGRPVLAVPGSIYSSESRGCHELIRRGAKLVTTVGEALLDLGFNPAKQGLISQTPEPQPAAALDKGLEMLLDALGFEPATVDVLAARTGLATEEILSGLTLLRLDGYVVPVPGGRYSRVS